MLPEWDILQDIQTYLLQFNICKIRHIKGHQDQNTAYEDLPLLAQLNCDADEQATQYISHHPDIEYRYVPLIPSNGAQLNLQDGTITSNIKQALRHAHTMIPLRHALCQKFEWNLHTFNDINWTAHGRALRRHQSHRVTMVKFLNGILPVGKMVHKYSAKYSPTCPSCPAQLEDTHHLFHCPAESRQSWRITCYQAVAKTLTDLKTPFPIQELFLAGFKAALHDTNEYPDPQEATLNHIAQAQTAIKKIKEVYFRITTYGIVRFLGLLAPRGSLTSATCSFRR